MFVLSRTVWVRNSLFITVEGELFSLVKISGKLYKSCMCLILSQSCRCLYIWILTLNHLTFLLFSLDYFCLFLFLPHNAVGFLLIFSIMKKRGHDLHTEDVARLN